MDWDQTGSCLILTNPQFPSLFDLPTMHCFVLATADNKKKKKKPVENFTELFVCERKKRTKLSAQN